MRDWAAGFVGITNCKRKKKQNAEKINNSRKKVKRKLLENRHAVTVMNSFHT